MKDHIVVLGGGTGLFTALSGLRKHDVDLTAVVTMADSGGSSGRLRDEFGYLPAGDVRRCLVALASDDAAGMLLRELFEYRFDRGEGLAGHSFGNLLLTALNDLTGSMDQALAEAAHLLRVKGQVLPVTLDDSHLYAELDSGQILAGEAAIDTRRDSAPISRVYLAPPATVTEDVCRALENATMVVIGPGDLYTSLIPALLVQGVRDAIAQTSALVVYVCNVMTKHGETDSFAASDFLRVVTKHLGDNVLDAALLSYYPTLSPEVRERYLQEHAAPVGLDLERCYDYADRLMVRPLAAATTLVRHDSALLAQALIDLLQEARGESPGAIHSVR